jgi:hypothetical protein
MSKLSLQGIQNRFVLKDATSRTEKKVAAANQMSKFSMPSAHIYGKNNERCSVSTAHYYRPLSMNGTKNNAKETGSKKID